MSAEELNKVVSSIDELVKMSGVKDEPSSLKLELERVDKELAVARDDLKTLTGIISPERYFDANSALVNQMIESELALTRQSLSMAESQNSERIASLKAELAVANEKLIQARQNLRRANECISSLEARLSGAGTIPEETRTNYDRQIARARLAVGTFTYEETTLEDQIDALKNQIVSLEVDNADIKASIRGNETFTRQRQSKATGSQISALRSRDEREADLTRRRITDLETQKVTLLNNPVLISSEAKKVLLDDNDITLGLSYIRKLVDIVNSQEFMDIPYSDDFAASMQERLSQAEEERDSFKASLSGKSYQIDSTSLDDARRTYLLQRKSFYEKAAADIRDLVASLDGQNGRSSEENMEKIEQRIADIDATIARYQTSKDLKMSEAELQAAILREQQRLNAASNLLNAYQDDTIQDATMASSLEKQTAALFELAAKNVDEELAAIEARLNAPRIAQEDTVAKSLDEAKLNSLIERVINLKKRMKFRQSPAQILAETEELLGTNLTPSSLTASSETYTEGHRIAEGLGVDHILDLLGAGDEPQLGDSKDAEATVSTPEPEPATIPTFEPFTPIDLSTYTAPSASQPVSIEPATYTLESDNVPGDSRLAAEETKRGQKVVDMTSLTAPKDVVPETPSAEPKLSTNPFGSSEDSSFNFSGDLLGGQEDVGEDLDFLTAADSLSLGLGKAA